MFTLIVFIHVVACLFLIGVVLVNVSKGSEVGAVFSGSQAIFGGAGPGTFLNKVTTVLAVVFFATSLALTYLSSQKVGSSIMEKVPHIPSSKVSEPSKPKLPTPPKEAPSIPTPPTSGNP